MGHDSTFELRKLVSPLVSELRGLR